MLCSWLIMCSARAMSSGLGADLSFLDKCSRPAAARLPENIYTDLAGWAAVLVSVPAGLQAGTGSAGAPAGSVAPQPHPHTCNPQPMWLEFKGGGMIQGATISL